MSSRILRESAPGIQQVWWRDDARAVVLRENAPLQHTQSQQQQRERELREAYERGLQEGRAAGRQQAAAEQTPVIERLMRSIAELSTLRGRIRQDAEGDLLRLAVDIARRVLHRELTLDPESIQGLLHVALEKLESRELRRVRVHASQEQVVRTCLAQFSASASLQVQVDPTLQPGDVLFETTHGALDASIESQLREIDRGLADRLQR
jgi:flagellar assembly protein FliH